MIIWRSCTEIIAQIRWFSLSKRLSGCKTLFECKQFLQCQLWSAGWRLNPTSRLQSCRFLKTKVFLGSHTCEFGDVMNPTAPWIRLISAVDAWNPAAAPPLSLRWPRCCLLPCIPCPFSWFGRYLFLLWFILVYDSYSISISILD